MIYCSMIKLLPEPYNFSLKHI